jgi:hypothetical protein
MRSDAIRGAEHDVVAKMRRKDGPCKSTRRKNNNLKSGGVVGTRGEEHMPF